MAIEQIPHAEAGEQEILRETALSDDPVKDYFRKIGRVPLLKAEEEVELSKRIEAGLYARSLLDSGRNTEIASDDELEWIVEDGKEAMDRMLEANLRLVVSFAKKYPTYNMSFLDIIQEGTTGLIRAVEKFDYQKGYKFSTYATWWLRQTMNRELANKGTEIRLPVHMGQAMRSVQRFKRKYHRDNGIDPTPEEIAYETGVSIEKQHEHSTASRVAISLDQPLGEDGGTTVGDVIRSTSPTDIAEEIVTRQLSDDIRATMETLLDFREYDVVARRYGFNGKQETLDEIAKKHWVSREYIRQLLSKATKKLKSSPEFKRYADVLFTEE